MNGEHSLTVSHLVSAGFSSGAFLIFDLSFEKQTFSFCRKNSILDFVVYYLNATFDEAFMDGKCNEFMTASNRRNG
jgi:hypothetical protein